MSALCNVVSAAIYRRTLATQATLIFSYDGRSKMKKRSFLCVRACVYVCV